MKKRTILTAFWAGLVCVSLCSCRRTEDSDERERLVSEAQIGRTEDARQSGEDLQTLETPAEEGQQGQNTVGNDMPEEQGTSDAEAAFSYRQMETIFFRFSSGAGGWSTDMTVSADGSFDGLYSDSDMGDMGEEYPNGTVYFCKFSGRFGELKKVDDFTYQTTIVEMQYENEPDTEEIIDDTLYRYTDVYGLENAGNIVFYLPGTPAETLSEECKSWLHDILYDWETGKSLEELPCVVLCNEAMGECFYSLDNAEF